MSKIYDNWEKLVRAVLRKEKDRELARCESFSTSYSTDSGSRFSFEFYDNSSLKIFFSSDVKAIEYEEIRKATRNFRPGNMLGGGPLVCVYKGWIDEYYAAAKPGFGIPVAVKILNTITNPKLEKWVDEMNNLSHLRHPNLLTPIGYSFDKDIRILVYEFLPKGSLDYHLFRGWQQQLPWETRIKVALGTAKALAFLHDMEIPVIYRKFRSDNIILDNDFNAKLSDIGLSKDVSRYGIEGSLGVINEVGAIYGPYPYPESIPKFWDIGLPKDISRHEMEDRQGIVNVIGSTYVPYAAPEYIATGHFSTGCDVYSFGVVLVELISGCRALDGNRVARERNLMDWTKPYLGNNSQLRIMDRRLQDQYPRKEAYKVGKIALQCTSLDPRSRPRMAEVVAALQQLL